MRFFLGLAAGLALAAAASHADGIKSGEWRDVTNSIAVGQAIMLTARDPDGDASYPIVDKHHYVICSPEVPANAR